MSNVQSVTKVEKFVEEKSVTFQNDNGDEEALVHAGGPPNRKSMPQQVATSFGTPVKQKKNKSAIKPKRRLS